MNVPSANQKLAIKFKSLPCENTMNIFKTSRLLPKIITTKDSIVIGKLYEDTITLE